jgi:hypothetical protein
MMTLVFAKAKVRRVTSATKRKVAVRLAESFCMHIEENCLMNGRELEPHARGLLEKAKRDQFRSPQAFVTTYDSHYARHMDDQSDAARALSVSIQRFDQTGELWGKQVLEIKDQKQRPATFDRILGYVKEKDGGDVLIRVVLKGVRKIVAGFMPNEEEVATVAKVEKKAKRAKKAKAQRKISGDSESVYEAPTKKQAATKSR